MKKVWHIAKRIMAALGLIVLLLLGSAIAFANTDYARNRLRNEVSTMLREDFGLEASFGEVELEVIPPRAHLLGSQILGRDGEPFVTVDRITVALQLAALLQGDIRITELTLEEPVLRLIVEGREIVNLPRIRRTESPDDGGDCDDGSSERRINDLGILAGRISLVVRDTPAGQLEVELDDVNVDVTFDEEGNPEARLMITGGEIRHGENGEHHHEVDVIQGRVTIRDGQALVRHVRMSVGEFRLSVPRATVGTSAPFDVEGNGEVWVPLELVRQLPLSAPPLQGDTHVSFQLTREEGRIEAEGSLEVGGLIIGPEFTNRAEGKTLGPHAIGDITADFAYTPDLVAMSELVIDRPAEGDGQLVLRDVTVGLSEHELPINAEIEFQSIELARILIDAGLYASRVKLKVSGNTTLVGRLRELRLRFLPLELHTRDFEVLTTSVGKEDSERVLAIGSATVRGKVVIDNMGVRLRGMSVSFGRTNLSVQALFGFQSPRRWWLRASNPENGEVRFADVGSIAGLEFGGHGGVTCNISGPYNDPTIRAQLDMRDFSIGSIAFGHVIGSLHYQGLLITLPHLSGDRGVSHFEFDDGHVDFRRGGVMVDGIASFDPLDLEEAVDMFGLEGAAREVHGVASGRALLSYSTHRNIWDVDVDTTVTDASYAGIDMGNVEAAVQYDGGDITIERFVANRDEAQASASGTVGRDGALGLDLEVLGLGLDTIEQLPPPVDELLGTLRGRARLFGTLSYPRATGWVDLSPVQYRATRFGPSRVRFEVDGSELTLTGGIGGRLVELEELRLTLQEPYPIWVRASVNGLELTDLLGADALPQGLGVRIEGRIDAGVDISRLSSSAATGGRRRQDYGLSGWASLDSLSIFHPAFTVYNTAPVRLDFQRDRANISTSNFAFLSIALSETTNFTLGGWASIESMGLELRGRELDLGFIPELLESVEVLSGTADVDCQIGGTYTEPALLGSASFRINRFVLAGLDYPVDQLGGNLRFSRNAILIEDLRAHVLGGTARGSGRVTLSGLSLGSYRLDATVHDARLPLGPRSSAVVNGTVNLTSPIVAREDGGDGIPSIGGQIEVVRLRYTEPIELVGFNLNQLGRRRRTEVQTYDPEGDQVRIDLRLTGGSNLRIENNLADAEVVIDDRTRPLSLVGTNQYQSLLGIVRVVEHGTVTFRDTEFEIERGTLELNDPFEFNPNIDFRATATRRDWTITLQILGTYHSPTVILTSDPPLGEEDIALLLTVGLTREETEQLGYGSATSSAIPELLWTMSGVDDEVNRLIPMLDELRITTDYSERTGRAEPRVRVGRRIRDNVRLGASAGLSDSRDFEANLEWELRDNLSLELVYENETDFNLGNIGGDIRWRMEF